MTVVNNMTEVDDCDTAGGGSWSPFSLSGAVGTLNDVDAASEDMTINIEGTQCYGFDLDKESGGYEYPLAGATDLSKAHLYIWVSVPTCLGGCEVQYPGSGQGGLYLTASDGTNRGYWHVAGSDTWGGEWQCFVAYLGDLPDSNSGSNPDVTQITYVGFGVNHPNAKSKAACNIFFDRCQYSIGANVISVYGGSAGSPLDFNHILTQDLASSIGVVRKVGGVYFLRGPIKFGHDSQNCYFRDLGATVVFEDLPVSGEFYKFEVLEGASQVTEFQLGTKSGTQGIQGCFIKAAGDQDWNFEASGETVESLLLYGNTLARLKYAFLSKSGEREVLSNAFLDQASGEIWYNGVDWDYNNVINPTKVGLVVSDFEDPMPANSNFIACPIAMRFDVSGEYSISNVVFTNCAVDIWNNSGGPLTINASGTSNPANTSGEVTLVNTKTHTLTSVVNGSEVTYVSGEGMAATVLHHVESITGNGTQYDYSYAGDFWVTILVNHLSYEPFQQDVLLGATSQSLPISQVLDRVYANP